MSDVVILTDLDGCLLNKHDYDYSPALPVLERLSRLSIPLVLCSSKTEAEMTPLANELRLAPTPITCENGGAVVWLDENGDVSEREVMGATRSQILEQLGSLKDRFQFRSFTDLGIDGIMRTTNLGREKATLANDRHCTEPLLWDDEPAAIDTFREVLETDGLTLTRGGRFWHVAGKVTKGTAMQRVLESLELKVGNPVRSIAIGDSPIDQSMLDIADDPIGIPGPDGTLDVTIREPGVVATQAGSAGWAEAVTSVLDRLAFPS